MNDRSPVTTFVFTDIEGSSRLWDRFPAAMRPALARHDELARAAVQRHGGAIVKMTGDGMHAAFDDPLDAIATLIEFQLALADIGERHGVALHARCGVHLGVVERRDADYFGTAVNRAARLMSTAHGGQVLMSQAVADLVRERMPAGAGLRDLGTVRLRDLETPERVFQLVHERLRRDFPALRSLESTPNNLPLQLTSFIGREREIEEAKRLLAGTRILTLHGPGGIGKTRLSLQLAADVLDDYPDGVWFVELAGLADARFVPQAVATALGIKEHAGQPVRDAITEHVRNRALLIVLDNCEHLVAACAEIAVALARAGPRVRVLASSRERLNVAGETLYEVPALAVPASQAAFARADLARYESVRLFHERAMSAQPRFTITEGNAGAVATIARRLDGIPLALELAAARIRSLSVDEIAARLDDRFRLLTGGDRSALPRQQTLQALIDWSYELLSPAERLALERLAVFAGGWTLQAAEAVVAGEPIDRADVVELIGNLVDKSLVAVEAEGARYRLLETVKQYAQQKLAASGAESTVRDRHLAYFLALAEETRTGLFGSDQATSLKRLDVERENLLAAHAWCKESEGGAEKGLALAYAVKRYWFLRGLVALGYRLSVEALAHPAAQARTFARCRGLFDAGQMGFYRGRYEEAQRYLEEGLSIARELGNEAMIAMILQPLGMTCLGRGDAAQAQAHLTEALERALAGSDQRSITAAQNALAQLHRQQGALDSAQPLYEEVVERSRALGDRDSVAIGLLNLAMTYIGRGANERARRAILEVLAIAEEIGSRPAGQSAVEVAAGLAASSGEFERALRFFGAAEAETGATGLQRDPADEAFLAPLIASARAALPERSARDAEAQGRLLTYDAAIAEVKAWLASASS